MKRSRLFLMLISARVALYRERRYSRALEDQLEGERARNLAREDELLTIPMRMVGAPGLLPRTGRAAPVESLRRIVSRRPPTVGDAWSMLTEDERAEWPVWAADIESAEGPMGDRRVAYQKEFAAFVMARRQMESGDVM